MAIVAHPDDIEFSSAGTIARWVDEGRAGIYVLCTDGGKGSGDRTVKPADLITRRQEEQLAAARLLGVRHVHFLGYPDGFLEETPEFRGRLVRLIRQHRPDTIITVDPYRRYQPHRDHRTVGWVALDACFPYARDHLYYPEQIAEGLEPHKVAEAYLYSTDQPDVWVDTSRTFARKIAALACHESQVGGRMQEIEERMRKLAEETGAAQGLPLAEAFKRLEFRR